MTTAESVEDSVSAINRLVLNEPGGGFGGADSITQLTRSSANETGSSMSPKSSPVVSPPQPTVAVGGGMDAMDYHSLIVPPRPPPTMTSTIRLHPLLGVAPLGTQPLDRLNMLQLTMLDAAAMHLPQPDDSERIRLAN